jgi:hypothetical protein
VAYAVTPILLNSIPIYWFTLFKVKPCQSSDRLGNGAPFLWEWLYSPNKSTDTFALHPTSNGSALVNFKLISPTYLNFLNHCNLYPLKDFSMSGCSRCGEQRDPPGGGAAIHFHL